MKVEQGFGPSFHSFTPPLAHRTTFFQKFPALVGRLNVKPFLGLRQVSRVSLRGKKIFVVRTFEFGDTYFDQKCAKLQFFIHLQKEAFQGRRTKVNNINSDKIREKSHFTSEIISFGKIKKMPAISPSSVFSRI